MMDISTITSISMDMAGRNSSFEGQTEISDVALYLLDRGYSIYLFTSNQSENLEKETFQHSRLTFLRNPITVENLRVEAFPELTAGRTFWVTDNPELQTWLARNQIIFGYTAGTGTFGKLGIKLGSISDITGLFNANDRVLREVAQAIGRRREAKGAVPFLIGVSGPAMSGFQQFGIDLRRELQNAGYALVDLLDLSALMVGGVADRPQAEEGGTWISNSASEWVVDAVLSPLRNGKRVFVERLPAAIPEAFEAHLPLFITEESLVVVLGQTLFKPEIRGFLDYSVLLEVSAGETARRLYEIPETEEFDDHFVDQYFNYEGGIYRDYLDTHKVREAVAARVNAERPNSLILSYLADSS